ncbi:MAG: hypothetical protein AAF270_07325 [Pseudomonadota bacterium]
MEVTMQWWDTADDWWYALQLHLDGTGRVAAGAARLAILVAAALALI